MTKTLGSLRTILIAGAFSAVGIAQAQATSVLSYSTFGRGGTSDIGYCINGPDATSCGGTTSYFPAASFIPTVSGPLDHIDLPLVYQAGTNGAEVTLVADHGGFPTAPTAVLESFTVVKLGACCSPTVKLKLVSKLHPALTKGTQYWILVAPIGYDSVGLWGESPTGTIAGQLSEDGGTTWGFSIPALAFDVWVQ